MPVFRILFSLLFLLSGWSVTAQPRTAAFYNVENFFDTGNDPASDDGDFTPEGRYRWDVNRFVEKRGRIAQVLGEIGADLVGLAEVENYIVLDSLIAEPVMQDLDYNYIHFDSPDPRGIDVALLYRRSTFRPEAARAVRYARLPHYRTREILHASGHWRGHPVHVLVCHLPSVLSSGTVREAAARSVGELADSLLAADPDHLLLVMGDFNANPGSRVLNRLTRGRRLTN
ncbi:endonuclease/exonuclease/phosphatase family protein, partial [Alistipes sp. OttesenSCG-928-L06]|nr:endonuclease/exonuclease/phosphatase family protein [Alistipes sp. OttesenSCG-928-L06]